MDFQPVGRSSRYKLESGFEKESGDESRDESPHSKSDDGYVDPLISKVNVK